MGCEHSLSWRLLYSEALSWKSSLIKAVSSLSLSHFNIEIGLKLVDRTSFPSIFLGYIHECGETNNHGVWLFPDPVFSKHSEYCKNRSGYLTLKPKNNLIILTKNLRIILNLILKVCMVNSTAIHLRDNDNVESSNGKNSSFNDYAHKIHLKNLAYAEECGDREIKTTIHRNLGYQVETWGPTLIKK